MILKRIDKSINKNIEFENDIEIDESKKLLKRMNDILLKVNEEITDYINEDGACFDDDSFPSRNRLTGNYYIERIYFMKTENMVGYKIMIMNCLTEYRDNEEDDYLGLEVSLYLKDFNSDLIFWGIDSSVI